MFCKEGIFLGLSSAFLIHPDGTRTRTRRRAASLSYYSVSSTLDPQRKGTGCSYSNWIFKCSEKKSPVTTIFGCRQNVHKIMYKRSNTSATFSNSFMPEHDADYHCESLSCSFLKHADAFWRFTRPHTIIGTVLGVVSVSLLPVQSASDISPVFLIGILKALLPAVFMNIYVVGLNQLFDIKIDKVNKPRLPLASGEISFAAGAVMVALFSIMSFTMGVKSKSSALQTVLIVSFVLGTAYSINLPFLRWKQHALLAASCILCVRAIVVQIAFFIHMQRYILRRPVALTKSVIFATAFMCFFSAVIALFKDIPDVEGDQVFGIESFSVRLGQQKVFWICIKLLMTAYAAAILIGVAASTSSSSRKYQALMTVLGHGLLAWMLWHRARGIDVKNKASVASFYMFIWKLFYAEYLLIPFVQ